MATNRFQQIYPCHWQSKKFTTYIPGKTRNQYRPELSVSYTLGVKQEFSEYCDYRTEEYYNSAEEALMGLFIEQCTEPELDINDIGRYYTDLDKKDEQGFREIIKEVYHVL